MIALRAAAVACTAAALAAAQASCGPGRHCPQESPCCSSAGLCGGGAAQCAGGCNPVFSFSAASCQPNPVCQSMNVSVPPAAYNNSGVFCPVLTYSGDPKQAAFTFNSGFLGKGTDGVLFEMDKAHPSEVATTRYMLYGAVRARLRHRAEAGLVTTFGTMSDVGDNILWQFGGGNGSQVSMNMYALNHVASPLGTVQTWQNFSFANFHEYGIVWQPSAINWTIDGRTVHSVSRAQGGAAFPRSPSRVVFRTFGTNSSSPAALRNWAGGALDFNSPNYQREGFFAQEFAHLDVACADLHLSNATISGAGAAPKAYFYTGRNSTNSGEPEFELTRDQIRLLHDPAADGGDAPGAPGQASTGPHANMYTGGGGKEGDGGEVAGGESKAQTTTPSSSASSSAPPPASASSSGTALASATPTQGDDASSGDRARSGGGMPVSEKLAIGVPVGVGGALLVGVLTLAACCLGRRRRNATRADAAPAAGGANVMAEAPPGAARYYVPPSGSGTTPGSLSAPSMRTAPQPGAVYAPARAPFMRGPPPGGAAPPAAPPVTQPPGVLTALPMYAGPHASDKAPLTAYPNPSESEVSMVAMPLEEPPGGASAYHHKSAPYAGYAESERPSLDEEDYYYQDPYSGELPNEEHSHSEPTESQHSHEYRDKPQRTHYAGYEERRQWDPDLSYEEQEEADVQSAWDQLRSEALGPSSAEFFQSHAPVTELRPRHASLSGRPRPPGPSRTTYSRGGAANPSAPASPFASEPREQLLDFHPAMPSRYSHKVPK
ncbi:hypothetical protein MSPP1_003024 [Malassezia sp. CBS 17886]|nr:hypothetical protein MSPP1_003024 [Malassezia sp. CBS 17886]